MERFSKSTIGVTLLEIMLVLAVAAMVIVLSVRYYQSANTSQQANAVMQQLQAITAAADSLSQSTGSYSGINASTLKPILPANGFNTPWGTTITVSGAANVLTITLSGTPAGVCSILTKNIAANSKYTIDSTCGTVTYTQ